MPPAPAGFYDYLARLVDSTTSILEFNSERAFTRVLAQGTAVAVAAPALTYSLDLSAIDLSTASLVLITSAGTVTVDGQLSFDGASNKAPAAITLFNQSASTTIIALAPLLIDAASNQIYGHYMTGDIDISVAASDIDLYLMAQGK